MTKVWLKLSSCVLQIVVSTSCLWCMSLGTAWTSSHLIRWPRVTWSSMCRASHVSVWWRRQRPAVQSAAWCCSSVNWAVHRCSSCCCPGTSAWLRYAGPAYVCRPHPHRCTRLIFTFSSGTLSSGIFSVNEIWILSSVFRWFLNGIINECFSWLSVLITASLS